MTFYIETMGCQMNKADSERAAGLLVHHGWEEVDEPRHATLILVNGCAVRARAEAKALHRVKELMRTVPRAKVGLMGCVAQWLGQRLMTEMPQLHLLLSPGRLAELEPLARRGGVALGYGTESAPTGPVRRCPGIKAWIPVMRGCDLACTFCVVPSTRGPEISFPPQAILDAASHAVTEGKVELDLLGQRVSAYRYGDVTFSRLVRTLARIPGVKRIRFTAPYPSDVEDDLLAVMAEEPVVERRLHLPLQSGADRILARMGRGYTVSQYLTLVEKARALIPDVSISTDLIVGFPGETEEDFEATAWVVAHVGFDTAFTFKFSPRPGTPAAAMAGQVPEEVKQERLERLIQFHHQTLSERTTRWVGRQEEVLVEAHEGYNSLGRTTHGRVATLPGHYELGTLVRVTVTEVRGHTLYGVPTEEA